MVQEPASGQASHCWAARLPTSSARPISGAIERIGRKQTEAGALICHTPPQAPTPVLSFAPVPKPALDTAFSNRANVQVGQGGVGSPTRTRYTERYRDNLSYSVSDSKRFSAVQLFQGRHLSSGKPAASVVHVSLEPALAV